MSATKPSLLLAASGLLASLTAAPALAESFASTAASSASSAGSASVASISDSVQSSSNSSARDGTVAEGTYRVVDVAVMAEKPDHLELKLRPDAGSGGPADDITLRIPQRTVQAQPLGRGDLVEVRRRPYGLEFAQRVETGRLQPFFLALAETWLRELDARPLSL